MTKIISFLKFIFYTSTLFLILLSLSPGSLLGLLFYGDLGRQPNLVENPFGTTINHFISYFYIGILGFAIYLRNENFNKVVFGLFFLSIILEILHSIIPNRAFQAGDLLGNILGVLVAYFLVKIYLLLSKS